MKRYLLISLVFLVLSFPTFSQFGFSIPADSGKVEIPFYRSNNLIIVPVTVNKNVVLRFILDSSVEHTILSRKWKGDRLGMNYLRKVKLGSINGEPNYGFSANGVQFSLGAATTSSNHTILVLENDFMNLSNIARMSVDGVIGFDLFGAFVVEIDNSKKNIILHPKSSFKKPKGYSEVPLAISGRKAYVSSDVIFENWDEENKKFQLKTGATHTVLFNSDSNLFHLPARKLEIPLGKGPSGPIEGYVGRVRGMQLGDYSFEDVIASFTKNEVGNKKETGSIGMGILSRFDMCVDYLDGKMYIKKNKEFNKSFEYDLSGMRVDTEDDEVFRVTHLVSDSPASKAGVQVGDRVVSIQGQALNNENFNELLSIFLEKESKRVKIEIDRGGEVREVSFVLRRLI